MEIVGKAAVVSGGGSGIGRTAVLALVERGAKIVVADIDEAAGRRTVDLAAEKGGSGVFARHAPATPSLQRSRRAGTGDRGGDDIT